MWLHPGKPGCHLLVDSTPIKTAIAIPVFSYEQQKEFQVLYFSMEQLEVRSMNAAGSALLLPPGGWGRSWSKPVVTIPYISGLASEPL